MKTLVLTVATVIGLSASAFALPQENNDSTSVAPTEQVTTLSAEQLPAAVKEALAANYPDATISELKTNGEVFFVTLLTDDGSVKEVKFDFSGNEL